mmetsp:Transcript_54588/g.169043  ORF Transcript_54588/g.169043 Transcript_54588/m.169043 type:complete len:335 (+) Transcript_54588:3-1007(+)
MDASRLQQLERQADEITARAALEEEEAKEAHFREEARDNKNIGFIDRYIDLLFRKYEFILWDPLMLIRKLMMRDHPMTGIFVPHARSLALERVLIFSCALIGSLMCSGLFYDGGAGNLAAPGPVEVINVTNATNGTNGTNDTDVMMDIPLLTTTTTAPPVEPPAPDPMAKMILQMWISFFSIVIAGVPAFTVATLFKRKTFTEPVPERKKKAILAKWKWKRRAGYCVAAIFLAFCYFYLWQFAMARPMDIQKDFTASSAISLIWKMFVKPAMVFMVITCLIMGIRGTSIFDKIMFIVPVTFFDFAMFTAEDIDDLLYFEELASGFMEGSMGIFS